MNDIKLRDARKILKKNGYAFDKISGDHWHFKKGNQRIVLPFHVNRGYECSYPIWSKACKRNNIQF